MCLRSNAIYKQLSILLIIILNIACSPTWKLKDDESLLNKYDVHFSKKSKVFNKVEIKDVIYPKTNRKIFGFYRFYLQMYYLGDTKNRAEKH